MEGDQRQGGDSAERPQKKTLVYKLVLLGDVYVGKTSIAFRLFPHFLLPSYSELGMQRENSQISKRAPLVIIELDLSPF